MRRSADELSTASCTPWKSSGSFTRHCTGPSSWETGGGTGTKLYGKLLRLWHLLLSLLLPLRHLLLSPLLLKNLAKELGGLRQATVLALLSLLKPS